MAGAAKREEGQAKPVFFVDIASQIGPKDMENSPIGGTQSALINLALHLQAAGQACAIFNKRTEASSENGLSLLPLEALPQAIEAHRPRALILCGRWTSWLIELLRSKTSAPFIAWQHQAALETNLTPTSAFISDIVFVSHWQQKINAGKVPAGWRQHVMNNAISAPFMPLLQQQDDKQKALCAYAGVTPRGLINLLKIWPQLIASRPQARLQIFCTPNLNNNASESLALTNAIRQMPGVLHCGAVPQAKLAAAYAKTSLFLSPNPFPETSCIALMEAMAAGLRCVITDRAALPETAAGFAHIAPLINAAERDAVENEDVAINLPAFIEQAIKALDASMAEDSLQNLAKLKEQQEFVHQHYTWPNRAIAWLALLSALPQDC